jgi:hypothetical protein
MNPLPCVVVRVAPVQAHCGVCRELMVCDAGDDELGGFVCPDCLPDLVRADAALVSLGFTRPPRGLAHTSLNR